MASHDHSDYVRGSQDISEQEATFNMVMALTKWGSLWIAALVLGLTLWFQPGGNFFVGILACVALLVVGFFALKKKPAH